MNSQFFVRDLGPTTDKTFNEASWPAGTLEVHWQKHSRRVALKM